MPLLERVGDTRGRHAMAGRTVSGSFDVRQIARAIMSKEAAGYRFAGNDLLQEGDDLQNLVIFDQDRGGRYTLDCIILTAEQLAPAGHQLEWSGTMFVTGKERQVKLYRKIP